MHMNSRCEEIIDKLKKYLKNEQFQMAFTERMDYRTHKRIVRLLSAFVSTGFTIKFIQSVLERTHDPGKLIEEEIDIRWTLDKDFSSSQVSKLFNEINFVFSYFNDEDDEERISSYSGTKYEQKVFWDLDIRKFGGNAECMDIARFVRTLIVPHTDNVCVTAVISEVEIYEQRQTEKGKRARVLSDRGEFFHYAILPIMTEHERNAYADKYKKENDDKMQTIKFVRLVQFK
jgi:hypothetical protein